MTNTTRLASCSLWVYSRNAARCSATAVFPVPGPPWTTSAPLCGARMIQSCSTWIVSTMSAIWPVRLAFSAASRAASPFSPLVGPDPATARSSTSSSSRVTSRPTVLMWRRRRTPSGDTGVAR